MSAWERLGGLVLRAYPRRFRSRYGAEMRSFLEEDGGGLRSVADLVAGAARAWADSLRCRGNRGARGGRRAVGGVTYSPMGRDVLPAERPEWTGRAVPSCPDRVLSPGGWTPPAGVRPGWDWLPPSGGSARVDLLPRWAALWQATPFLDRWAYAWMWRHGAWEVHPWPEPAPAPAPRSPEEAIVGFLCAEQEEAGRVWASDPASVSLEAHRDVAGGRVQLVSFDSERGRQHAVVVAHRHEGNHWHVSSASGQADSAPAALAELRFAASWDGEVFVAFAELGSHHGERVDSVLIRCADGLSWTEQVEVGHVLAVHQGPVEAPVHADLLGADGGVLATVELLERPLPPPRRRGRLHRRRW